MNKNFSLRLALNNIKNNRKFYLPYYLSAAGIVGMFYIICFLALSPDIAKMSASLSLIMGFGSWVMAIFAFIFLFYINSFLMKRRKKEIGLYNILGMEKRHIGKILVIENLLVSVASLVSGILCGILFSKLIHLVISWLFGVAPPFGISVSAAALIYCVILFSVLFFLTLASNLWSIRLAKPVELLQGSNVGEKEPKSKWFMAIAGFVSLGAGYFIALTTESPLTAIALFFVAVVLVINGTYCLFTAGSVTILKALRKNKRFYYKPGNFTAVSGLIYRMKQNAVGLASICILSTMVLVMISGTVSLFMGTEDVINKQAPGDVNVNIVQCGMNLNRSEVKEILRSQAEKDNVSIESITDYQYLPFAAVKEDEGFSFNHAKLGNLDNANTFAVFSEKEYTKLTGETLNLAKGEAAACSRGVQIPEQFYIGEKQFTLKEKLKPFVALADIESGISDVHYLVTADDSVVEALYEEQKKAYDENASDLVVRFIIDIADDDEAAARYVQGVWDSLYNYLDGERDKGTLDYTGVQVNCRSEYRDGFMDLVGSFLFLGIFLGIVFTFAAALIIYYKQITEGYYDKDKFEIMQKVGMSKAEVKSAIRKQVLLVFFAPLLMSGLHILAAFKMITKLLLVFSMNNVPLFALCTLGTFLMFAVIYALVYLVTAREYYKIVG